MGTTSPIPHMVRELAEFMVKGSLAVNVMDHDATGDGITDDTGAVQAAVNSLALTGGTVFFPPGKTYKLAGAVELVSNLTVEFTGATLYKDGVGQSSANVFVGKSRGGKGYGSGPSNIVIRGGTISGRYHIDASSGAGTTLHHSQNVLFENVTFQSANITGHTIDLGGCDGVTIRNCTFAGWSAASGRTYVEAIQLDNSFAIGVGIDTDLGDVYDGLATRNTIIEGCRFVPLVVNGVTYPAPHPVGNHSIVQNNPTTGLIFRNNLVMGGRRTDDVGDNDLRGWLHFYTGNDMQIVGNTFINTSGVSACVVGVRTGQNGILLSDVGSPAATNKPVTPTPVTNLTIEGNTFTGFNGTDMAEFPILLFGLSTAKLAGIRITGNNITKSHPTSTNGANGTTFVKVDQAKNVAVDGNNGDDIFRVADLFNCDGLSFSRNQFTRVRSEVARASNSTSVSFVDNAARESTRGLYSNACAGLVARGNRIQGAGPQMFAIIGTSDFLVTENIFTAAGTVAEGIAIWGGSTKGRLLYNMFSGTFTTKVTASGTDVTEVGTIS